MGECSKRVLAGIRVETENEVRALWAGGQMINDENVATLGGVVGDRINVERGAGKPSSFSIKTVRQMQGIDGDVLDKFDWHTVVCMDAAIVDQLRQGMRVRVTGAISTTRAKSAIIASSIELEGGKRWPSPNRRRSG